MCQTQPGCIDFAGDHVRNQGGQVFANSPVNVADRRLVANDLERETRQLCDSVTKLRISDSEGGLGLILELLQQTRQ